MTLVDEPTRQLVVSEFRRCFLVEAAAGTGKTSLMAGRVTMMLAHGYPAAEIAAITFTELAAAELKQKIRETVGRLLADDVPRFLKSTLPKGLDRQLKANLESADLDELTATTIHGFCQAIIEAHGVSAGLDPGAQVIEEAHANQIFASEFEGWFERSLTEAAGPDDPVVVLSEEMPRDVVGLFRELAELRRGHREAEPVRPGSGLRPDVEFVEAVDGFVRWQAAAAPTRWTHAIAAGLGALRERYDGALRTPPSFRRSWSLANPTHDARIMPKGLRNLLTYSAAAEAGGAFGDEWRDPAAESLYGAVEASWQALQGHLATTLVASASDCLEGMLEGYDARKRASAALDFDDLISHARTLVREHEDVRSAVGARYRYLLIDEAQDTDAVQSEILFSIAAEERPKHWSDARLRPGALFLVGDPKQAIYRFRGADIAAYEQARAVIAGQAGGEVLRITANFRSQEEIITHVNDVFGPIFTPPRQPDYVRLTATVEDNGLSLDRVVRNITVLEEGVQARAYLLRDAEADRVAEVCDRLVGNLTIPTESGRRLLRRSDIALLSPGHRDLWRYERALEARRIVVASQAGQSLMLRQETQDVLALLRVLADGADSLAFGALMSGPLIGLTDEELLDITAALPSSPSGRRGYFSVLTPADWVTHPLAKAVLEDLQALRREADLTTPAALLAEAVERLRLRVVMALRHRHRNPRALANLDALIERARAYDVAGLKAFIADLQADWILQEDARVPEGRVDAADDAVQIVTMFSAKGLEWPVVIPINSTSGFAPPRRFVWRQSDQSLHWIIGGVVPPDLAAARAEEAEEEARQRERIWYVTCTRAKDLLILPLIPDAPSSSWYGALDLGQAELAELDISELPFQETPLVSETNDQSPDKFAREAAAVIASSPPVKWIRPSERDGDRRPEFVEPVVTSDAAVASLEVAGAGALRGTVLHKLMEESLLGALPYAETVIAQRASVLLQQLLAPGVSTMADPSEMAKCILETLSLEEIAERRSRLFPEVAVWGSAGEAYLAGRADALEVRDDRIEAVFDWKSDVSRGGAIERHYEDQLRSYMKLVGCQRGAIVYMSLGQLHWVEADRL